MAFQKKTWVDRLSEFAGRRILTRVSGSADTQMVVDVARAEGNVSREGDPFSASNMNDLEQRIADEFEEINNDLVSNVYIGDDGKIHVVKGGADSGLNFSSFPENLRFYTTRDFDGSILSFKVKDKSILTFSLNTRYNNGAGYYPTQDYLEIFDGQPTVNDYTNLISGLSKIATLSKNGMTFIDASPYLALCKTGYITLAIHSKSANAAICYVKDIVLK